MINKISEGSMRTVMKIDPVGPIHDQEDSRQKTEHLRQARPVEASAQSARHEPQSNDTPESSKYLVDDEKLVFEKYNQKGDVVYRLPPSSKPIDERA